MMTVGKTAIGRRAKCQTLVAVMMMTGLNPTSVSAVAALSGTFAGTAVNSQNYTPPFGNFDGSTVTGSFLLDLSGCVVSVGPGPSTGGCDAAVSSFLKPVVPGGVTDFGQPDTFVQVTNTASMQRLSIVFGYMNPYTSADLELVGGVNAFINGSDYSSLHAGAIDLTRSALVLRGGRSYGTGVALNSFAIDQAVAGVPEASLWSMLLAGFIVTGWAVRRREQSTAGMVKSRSFPGI